MEKNIFSNHFSDANTARSIFSNQQESEGLDILSSLLLVSQMVCNVLPGKEDKMLMRSLRPATDMYLFYFYKCFQILPEISLCKRQGCLWGLCSSEREGLQEQEALFDLSDPRRHRIEELNSNGPFNRHFGTK